MRIAVVTGASSGMGRYFVKEILKEERGPDEIWLVARRKDRLTALQDQYKNRRFRILPLDLQKEEDMERLRELTAAEKPQVDILVHSAGLGKMGKIEDMTARDQEEMVNLNCRSLVDITSLFLPHMVPGGRMIYMVSAAGFLPQPGFATYAATKAFALSYVRALRAETRDRKFRITAVCPGAVKTEFIDKALGDRKLPAYKKLVMADPEKVVRKAWKDNRKGREMSVYGLPIRLMRVAVRLIPHRVILAFMGK